MGYFRAPLITQHFLGHSTVLFKMANFTKTGIL